MTAAEQARREELARLMHQHWVAATRAVLTATEPLFRSSKRTPANSTAWASVDTLVLRASKKWECLKGAERHLALAQADGALRLLRELGELKGDQ